MPRETRTSLPTLASARGTRKGLWNLIDRRVTASDSGGNFFNYRRRRTWMIYRPRPSTIEVKLITKCIMWRLNERHERQRKHISHQLWDFCFFCFSIIGFNWTIGHKSMISKPAGVCECLTPLSGMECESKRPKKWFFFEHLSPFSLGITQTAFLLW